MSNRSGFPFVLLALCLVILSLTSCGSGRRAAMLALLDEADSLNRNYIPLTNDTALLDAVAYFDSHGTANERMRARYLLGCVYRDKGQSPMAVDSYQDAVACADTTSSDCDYRTLSAVYSQMGEQYHKQLLFSYEIEARRQAEQYAYLNNDTLWAIFEKKMIAGDYILLNKKDSAELLLKETLRLYEEQGNTQEALLASNMLMHLYIFNSDKQDSLKNMIDRFDAHSNLFGKHHELPPGKRMFYYYKGSYFEGVGQLDSAEYYYRKFSCPVMSLQDKNFQYKALFRLFQKRQQPDSIAKYAVLYGAANDSSIAVKDQALTAQLAASYQYSTFQQQVIEKEREVNSVMRVVFVLLFVVLCVVFTSFVAVQHYKKKKSEVKAQFERATEEYERNIKALKKLEQSHKTVIQFIQEELDKANSDNAKYQQRNLLIERLNKEYEENKLQLTQENNSLRRRVEELRRRSDVTIDLERSQRFFETEIAHRVEELSNKPQLKLTNEEKDELLSAVGQYFPDFLHDLNNTSGISQLGMYVCVLVAMQVRTNDIANMLDISGNQVSNLKQAICTTLFGNNSARKLYDNLKNRYGILSH